MKKFIKFLGFWLLGKCPDCKNKIGRLQTFCVFCRFENWKE